MATFFTIFRGRRVRASLCPSVAGDPHDRLSGLGVVLHPLVLASFIILGILLGVARAITRP